MGRLPFTYKDLIPFVEPVMDHPRDVEKLARLVWAILSAGSARKSDWARHYRKEAGERTNYKAIERLMEGLEPERLLHRLIDPETPFVLVDLTEIPRPKATRTPYVGRLKDGRLGFTAFLMAQPYQGREIPVYVGVYSEATLNEEIGGRNLAEGVSFGKHGALAYALGLVWVRRYCSCACATCWRCAICTTS